MWQGGEDGGKGIVMEGQVEVFVEEIKVKEAAAAEQSSSSLS